MCFYRINAKMRIEIQKSYIGKSNKISIFCCVFAVYDIFALKPWFCIKNYNDSQDVLAII